MGERLLNYYKYVGDRCGREGKLELARSTKIPATKAALEPDSKENIELFRKAVESITGESAPTV